MCIRDRAQTGFSLETLFARAVEVRTQAALAHGESAVDAAASGRAIMAPGGFIKDPVSAISFGLALMLGTAGLPHILMRFFTVPDAKEARKSVLWATGWIGYFYILTFIIGFGAILLVGTNAAYLDGEGALRGGGNMAAIHLAHAIGGNAFLGFISAVAFATILAVVAGAQLLQLFLLLLVRLRLQRRVDVPALPLVLGGAAFHASARRLVRHVRQRC